MKKYICILCMIMSVMLVACKADVKFNGSRTGNEDWFFMDYSVLNTTDSHELEMSAGEMIEIEMVSDSGKVSVTIQKENADPVYQEDELDTGTYSVEIPEAGIYTITVEGIEASGSIKFTRG